MSKDEAVTPEGRGEEEAARLDTADDGDGLTPEERRAFEALGRTAAPPAALEERTVVALRERGLLGGRGVVAAAGGRAAGGRAAGGRAAGGRLAGTGARWGRIAAAGGALGRGWWAAGVAAALALFLAGVVVGQARAAATAGELVRALREATPSERPALVQRTGSLYVESLARLVDSQRSGEHASVGTGVEVGIAALHAAAVELARLHPEDPRLRRVLDVLEEDARSENPGQPVAPRGPVHWF